MACAYLLTLNVAPGPPVLGHGASVQERAKLAAEQVMNAMPVDESAAELISATTQPEEDLVKLELADGESGNGTVRICNNSWNGRDNEDDVSGKSEYKSIANCSESAQESIRNPAALIGISVFLCQRFQIRLSYRLMASNTPFM